MMHGGVFDMKDATISVRTYGLLLIATISQTFHFDKGSLFSRKLLLLLKVSTKRQAIIKYGEGLSG